LAPAADNDLASDRGKAIASAAAPLLKRGQELLDLLRGLDDLFGAGGPLLLELRPLGSGKAGRLSSSFWRWKRDLSSSSRSLRARPPLASPALGLVLERGKRPDGEPPRRRGDDVQGEVKESRFQVAAG